jgi:hypothetical protein
MEVRRPCSSLVQVGGKQEQLFWRLGFQGTAVTACVNARVILAHPGFW